MKNFILAIVAGVFLAGCASSGGDGDGQLTVEAADIPLKVLIGKMQAANDPREICRSADSYVLRQQMEREGDERDRQYQVEIKFQKKPYFSKTTVFFDGKPETVTLFDGTRAWAIDPSSGVSTALTGARLKMVQALGKIGNPSYTYADIFPTIELAQLVSGTREYYRLICIARDEEVPPLTIFVDKNNFLTRKVALTFKTVEGATVKYSSYINQYSLMSGVMMPAVVTVETNGVKFQYKTTEFKLNVKFTPDEFALPTPWYINVTPREVPVPAAKPTAKPVPKPPLKPAPPAAAKPVPTTPAASVPVKK